MEIAEVLESLYSVDAENVLKIIRQTKYSKEAPQNCLAMHTGFTFKNHKGTTFEVFLSFDNQILYRQVVKHFDNLPKTCGTIYEKQGDYFDSYILTYVYGAEQSGDRIDGTAFDTAEDYHKIIDKIKSFKIFVLTDGGNQTVIRELPLRRSLDTILFMGNNEITEYIPIQERQTYSQESEEPFGQYSGSYAQEIEGLSDDFINDVLDGDPDAYWNID
ncbi:hypothetical protein [Rufibacter latericius]|uniref:Uncharacterized protein n=1 Tax=Rufibacter latericius TaxID=2487040 RepID=A0A3M9MAL4_9BACT|nr:hypothetical protein [Rufibacter latericius]RNI22612.1 hypothetical protein EFB08_21185 [Rufibacter latericius]